MRAKRAMGRGRAAGFISPNRAIAAAALLAAAAIVVGYGAAAPEAQSGVQTITCDSGFGAVADVAAVFVPLTSLKSAPNPVFPPIDPATNDFDELGVPQDLTRLDRLRVDDNLAPYLRDVQAAVQLGKALFWDMQAGSDDRTACGTCHFHAGADGRTVNQLSPGANKVFTDGHSAPFAPNHELRAWDFPFTGPAGDTTDNAVGSQGVRKAVFGGLDRKGNEITTTAVDDVFQVGGNNIRQVGAVQAPSVINAVFNHRNFWDGRAQPDFNGVSSWGTRDDAARVWALDYRGNPIQTNIRIPDAALASQAVGPPLNDLEMTASGRTFPDLGRKLLARKPLALQNVATTDSVLGGLADATTGKGLKTTYSALVQAAFAPSLWNSTKSVGIGGKSYTMTQANFSLFWGLSIMLYEATLVSDDTPMDRYLASRVFDAATNERLGHQPELLQPVVDRLRAEMPEQMADLTADDIVAGLALFELPLSPDTAKGKGIPDGSGAACSACHTGAELTSASVRNLTGHAIEPGDAALRNVGFDLRMERMFMQIPPVPDGSDQITFDPVTYDVTLTRVHGAEVVPTPVPLAVYDTGWYNIGVRPTVEDHGLGGKDPFGTFLSWTRSFKASPNPSMFAIPGGGLGCEASPPSAPAGSVFAGEVLNPLTGLPLLAGALRAGENDAVDGSFKTPSLRNVELTGPYFHNGGKATLGQVVEFYDLGADFTHLTNPTRAPLIMPMRFTEAQERNLLAFLVALTDERVRFRRAPFDHPEIVIPHGADGNGGDMLERVEAVGAGGNAAPLGRFLGLPIAGELPAPPETSVLPVAVGDSYSTPQNAPVTMAPLENDMMSDGTALPAGATIEVVSVPALGSLQQSGNTFVFTPSASGTTSMQYRVSANGATSQATQVTVTITPVTAPPVSETVRIERADYLVRLDKWVFSGTSNVVNASLEVRCLAPGASDGPVMGRAAVAISGGWFFEARKTGFKPGTGSQIKVLSPGGTVALREIAIIR